MRILYVGPDLPESHMTSWRNAFRDLGYEVATVDAQKHWDRTPGLTRRLLTRVLLHPGKRAMDEFNRDILAAAREFRPELTFLAPGRYVYPDTIPECRKHGLVLLHTNDDMFNRMNQPPYFEEIVRAVDCIVTIKSFNVQEFYDCGAARVVFVPSGYDPAVHYPVKPDAADLDRLGCDIGFVGSFRPERADFLERLLKAGEGATARIWGYGWEKRTRPHYRIPRYRWPLIDPLVGTCLDCADYRKVMQTSKICLGLLNHRNRDLHTGRTFEIPACGGFMLAERTDEHGELFAEDKEAVYFSSFEELVEKMKFFLSHPAERSRIAEAGYRRCVGSGYRFIDRASTVLGLVREMKGQRQKVS